MTGYETYQLALELNPDLAGNVYTIYAAEGGEGATPPLSFPPAYQVASPFGADIGGTPPLFWTVMPDAQWDSWLTIGPTDASQMGSISSINLDFASWTETQGLSATDAAVFYMDPNNGPAAGDSPVVVIAQLTVPSGTSFQAIVSAQGKPPSMGVGETWAETDITFNV